jgi:hypothetical protein
MLAVISIKTKKTIILLLLPFLGFSQVKLEPKNLFDGKIQVSIPVELNESNNPLSFENDDILFVNRDKNVILSISYTTEKLNLNQFYAYQRFLIKGLKEDFPDIIIADSGVVKNNERQIGFIECQQAINDKTVYSSIYFTSVKGRIFKISLEYAKDYQTRWKNVSKDIMETLKPF